MYGLVLDESKKPLRNAEVKIHNSVYRVSKNMAYYKAVLPIGDYVITISSAGYKPKSVNIHVGDNEFVRHDVSLEQDPSSTNGAGNLVIKSESFVNAILEGLVVKYSKIATLHEIGRTKHGKRLTALQIHSADKSVRALGQPSILFTAGILQGAPMTSKVLINLAKYILMNYKSDTLITNYVQNISIFIAPDLNPQNDFGESCIYRNERAMKFPVDDYEFR